MNTARLPASSAPRLHQVDVLRGFAALTVVLSHYIPYWNRYLGEIPVWIPNSYGENAVKLFFAISGFVIFATLERCRTVLDFAALRFSRLYPAYWVSLAVATVVSALVFDADIWRTAFVANITMFQEFLGYPNLDNVYWSLTVELAFYLNVAWLFALGWHRRCVPVVLGWLLLAAVWSVSSRGLGHVLHGGAVSVTPRELPALLLALDYAPFFSIGMLCYYAKTSRWTATTRTLLLLAIGVEFLLEGWTGAWMASGAAIALWLAINGQLRFITGRATLRLGAISFSLYLVHRNLGFEVLRALHGYGLGAVSAIVVTSGAALLLAAILTYAVERPALSALRAAYQRRLAPTKSKRPAA